jgi:tetratricopeptide (TPR) repeat protein
MQRDYLGNSVSGERPGTLSAIDDFVEGFLAYETRAERIIEAAKADPSACLANVYAGLLCMLLEAPEAAQHAAPFLAAAEVLAPMATAREQRCTALLRAWVGGDVALSLRLCDEITDEHPRDLTIVKLQQYFEFNRGDSPAMLKVALKALRVASDVPYVHGMCAFAYEQCHLLEEAEQSARRALSMRDKEPWAQHALAHVMLTQGRIDEGAQFLENVAPTWVSLNSFMLTHLWWHLALFYISQGRDQEALELYDRHCWGVVKQYSQDQVGAVSLLARLEMAGIDVGDRWGDVADHLQQRAHDTVQPFLTLQYLYGLARARRPEAEELLQTVRRYAVEAPQFTRAAWQQVVLPAAQGLVAHARGDFGAAWAGLSTAIPRMNEVGGSHAQRDLFDQFLVDAARQGGLLTDAQQRLELRRQADPEGVPVNTALAQVYGKLGLPALSQQAAQRAAKTRERHVRVHHGR